MDNSSAGRRLPPAKNQLQIQGPRPPPLSINKDSHKIIKKPPKPPLDPKTHHHRQQPIIIYTVSPKIIYANVDDFMTTVQRLTGISSDDFNNAGDVSPAARLASIEKASPKGKNSAINIPLDRVEETNEDAEEVEMGRGPGILSPATLPPVIQEMFFSPATESRSNAFWASSPSGLFSGAVGSPIFSPDYFGQIWNFQL